MTDLFLMYGIWRQSSWTRIAARALRKAEKWKAFVARRTEPKQSPSRL